MAKKKIKRKSNKVTKPADSAAVDNISSEVIAAAYSAVTQPALPIRLKVCRLCESKDGPFLNIFDADKLTAKKIDELMPFTVLENDDLPHKICFRCSAKLEELYEFIQKCIKTQENLHNVLDKAGLTKSKIGKKLWEEKLNKSNMTNDDICDALIKKAMEGIQGLPSQKNSAEEHSITENKRITRSKETQKLEIEKEIEAQSDEIDDVSLKRQKMSIENKPPLTKVTSEIAPTNKTEPKQQDKTAEAQSQKMQVSKSKSRNLKEVKSNEPKATVINNLSFDYEEPATIKGALNESEENKKEDTSKPFDIMDYISMIKVNGVGVLFQCKLCNRNFLKKEVVESHNCAKNGGIPKIDLPKFTPAPELPKASTVKYIKTDGDMKKFLTEKTKNEDKKPENVKDLIEDSITLDEDSITLDEDSNEPPKPKSKPKVGPASKTGRSGNISDSSAPMPNTVQPPNVVSSNPSIGPSVHFPTLPNLNSRYKLVPGPDNIFTLVEDSSNTPLPVVANTEKPADETKKSSRKRKSNEIVNNATLKLKETIDLQKSDATEVIDLENPAKPYPVGLFQTMAHSARLYEPSISETPATFTTPAMKKQSYTVVQTGNPNKLLISTKAAPVQEQVKKRQRKSAIEVRDDDEIEQPYRVTLEDVAPPKQSGIFAFINVDPLLQPSYVLPTDNIIQESQISTSSAVLNQPTQNKDKEKEKDKYPCNMCCESFSREKKLLTHIKSHYMKMDEEDQIRVQKSTRRKGKK